MFHLLIELWLRENRWVKFSSFCKSNLRMSSSDPKKQLLARSALVLRETTMHVSGGVSWFCNAFIISKCKREMRNNRLQVCYVDGKIEKNKTWRKKKIDREKFCKICVIIFTSNMLCLIYEFILIINYNHLKSSI